eukprot:5940650-Pyramimonas_sp.AAC.1
MGQSSPKVQSMFGSSVGGTGAGTHRVPAASWEREYTHSGHQSQKRRENIPIAGTNHRRGERIYP